MSFFMIGRVESALLQSRRFFSLVSKTRSARLGVSLVLIGGVLATRNASNTAACEGGSLLNLGQDPAKKKALNGIGGGSGGSNDPVKSFLDKYSGFLQNLGFSGVMGICSGAALKKATREVAVTIGVAFAGLQVLSYLGYITIDYSRVQKDASKYIDINGDGKVDTGDLYSLWDKVKDVLGYQLPQAGSFSTGFALGFYYF